MTAFRSDFLRESYARGLAYQGTHLDVLDERMCRETVTAYIGFDATAPSLHVGNLIQIMRLRLLQRTGHRPIILIGDGTTRVGDPSGKDTQRQLLDVEKIEQNILEIQHIFARYLDFDNPHTGAILVRNYEWLKNLHYLDFLRDYGRHFSINRMLTFESVKARLDREQPLSFLEFNYMILQAYDFLELHRSHNCILQLGGSDQWGNILNGVELIRRVENKDAFGLTGELITTSDGKKMGKSEKGAIWLNSNMLPSYDFWQFWRNTQDTDVGRFLRLFTDLPLEEIAHLESLKGAELNDVKKLLADEVTRLCHGEIAVQQAHETVNKIFYGHSEDLTQLVQSLPTFVVTEQQLIIGILLIDILVQLGLAESKGEARRLIRAQAIRVDNKIISDELYKIALATTDSQAKLIKISSGKKRHGLLKLEE